MVRVGGGHSGQLIVRSGDSNRTRINPDQSELTSEKESKLSARIVTVAKIPGRRVTMTISVAPLGRKGRILY